MTVTLERTLTAREYQRVSQIHDPRHPDKSPEEQHGDNQRAAGRHGWVLHPDPYRDKVSASRYSSRVREDFDRLVADLAADRFGAQILVLWESSRGSRRVSEWVALLELCEERRVRIYVTSDARLYDPAEPRDRRSLLEDAVDAEYESAKTSKRMGRVRAAEALAGKPHGRVPYGYTRTYDPKSGRPDAQVVNEAEAVVVREIYARLHAGHSLRAIERDFAARGITTRSGKAWTYNAIRDLALTATPAGLRIYQGETIEGTWPAIVDRSVWLAVTSKLSDRKGGRPGRAVHLLTMIARCDVCGAPLSYRNRGEDGDFYRCQASNCVHVAYAPLNAYVETVLLAYLCAEGNLEALTVAPVDPAAAETAKVELGTVTRELDELTAKLGTGSTTVEKVLTGALPQIEARLKAAQDRYDDLTRPAALRGLLPRGSSRRQVMRWWTDAPLSARREVLRFLASPQWLGQLRITRAPRIDQHGHRGAIPVPVAQRVIWHRV